MSEETIFAAALEKPTSERLAYLDQACGANAELRDRVEQLLAAHDNPDSIFDSPANTEVSTSTPASNLPKRLGDFEIIRQIGQGGMGVVFEARQISLNRRVALKVLSSGLGPTAKAVMRFRREAEAAAKLHHTNIVPIYITGEDGGVHFYAMELVEGPSLDKVIQHMWVGSGSQDSIDDDSTDEALPGWVDETIAYQRPSGDTATSQPSLAGATSPSLSTGSGYFDAVAKMIAEVADALEHAHDNGVIHRDMKPLNLLLAPDGRLSVNDFGLARMLEQPGMTMTGEFVGSPLYMSPEQITAGRAPLDHRTDIYSLGATLYELLTLQPPFPGASRDQVIGQILHKEPKSPRRLNKRIPADLETICLKAIERDPDRRYQTAGHLADDLHRFVTRHAISVRRIGPMGRTVRWARRNRAWATMVAFTTVLAIATMLVAWRSHRNDVLLRRDRAMGEALAFAMNGDLQRAEEKITEAELRGASVAWVEILQGQVSLYHGDSSEAIDHLERAVSLEPEGVAARAMLTDAYMRDGQWQNYLKKLAELDAVVPQTDEDFLFLASARMVMAPEDAVSLLDQAVQKRRSLMSLAIRSQALAIVAMDNHDTVAMERALQDAHAAVAYLPDNPVAQAADRHSRSEFRNEQPAARRRGRFWYCMWNR